MYRTACVKDLRKHLGWTRQKFAFLVGVSEMTVHRWETARSTPGGVHLGSMNALAQEQGIKFQPFQQPALQASTIA